MTIKEEFKLVKKVLRKHGCLRAYRRMLRKEFDRTLLEDVSICCGNTKEPYFLNCFYYDERETLWDDIGTEIYCHKSRYAKQK